LFNMRVELVPRFVEGFLGAREARLNRRASFGTLMSEKKPVKNATEVTIYLDTEGRAPYTVVLR